MPYFLFEALGTRAPLIIGPQYTSWSMVSLGLLTPISFILFDSDPLMSLNDGLFPASFRVQSTIS